MLTEMLSKTLNDKYILSSWQIQRVDIDLLVIAVALGNSWTLCIMLRR